MTRPHRTGTENYSLHVLRHLLQIDTENAYRLYLSSELPPGLLPLTPRTTTKLIRLPRLWTHIGLSSQMKKAAPDVLFVPSHVLPLITPRKSVVVVYDVGHRFFPRAHRVAERLYLEWAIRRHVRIATRLLTISESSKRDIVRVYGADPTRIDVAYPAVEPRFKPASPQAIEQVIQRYGVQQPYVLHLGTIKARKNLPRLIHAFAEARLDPRTQLVLGGMTTSGSQQVEAAINQTRLGKRLHRLAYVPDEDLPALYSGAACVGIVSLYEGFGMPALEALACGAPVVASNRGSLPEIVGGAGVQVDPLDIGSIAAGLERAVAETSLAKRGPIRAAQFDWSTAAQITLSALETAAGSVPSRTLSQSAAS